MQSSFCAMRAIGFELFEQAASVFLLGNVTEK
jgi:hypothetical protein